MKQRLAPLAAALAAALLAACGGGGGGDPQLADLQIAQGPSVELTPTLFDDEGEPMPAAPKAVPVDTGAHTRSGLYAQRRQADTLEQAMPGRMVRVEVSCCDAEAIDVAVASAEVEQVSLSLPRSAPILVSGANLRHAAVAADRLAEGGATRVFLVTD